MSSNSDFLAMENGYVDVQKTEREREREKQTSLISSKYSTSSKIPWLPAVQTDYVNTDQLKL